MLNIKDYNENDLVEITNQSSAYYKQKGVVVSVRKYVLEIQFRGEFFVETVPFMPFEVERI